MSKKDWSNLIEDKVDEEFEEPVKADLAPKVKEISVESDASDEKEEADEVIGAMQDVMEVVQPEQISTA